MEKILISRPQMGQEEIDAVSSVLRSGMLASGPKVKAFESEFASFCGADHAVATSSGTTALQTILHCIGIKPKDRVLVPSFSFIATAAPILELGAKPVFVDVDPKTFCIDAEKMKKKFSEGTTKALVAVDLYGLPANWPEIQEFCESKGIFSLDDACQAHGASINGKRTGSFADATVFSFYPTKNMGVGEGGMIVTSNLELAEKCRLFINHGMKVRYSHESLGFNYRMTDISAAIGLEQLKKLPSLNEKRKRNAALLDEGLAKAKGISIPFAPPGFDHVYHQYTIKLDERKFGLGRDRLIAKMNSSEIYPAIFYPIPIHKQKPFLERGIKARLPITEKLCGQVLSLPVHPALGEGEISRIVSSIKSK